MDLPRETLGLPLLHLPLRNYSTRKRNLLQKKMETWMRFKTWLLLEFLTNSYKIPIAGSESYLPRLTKSPNLFSRHLISRITSSIRSQKVIRKRMEFLNMFLLC